MSDTRYAQLDVVGSGGMGEVQRLQDHVLQRSVARKVMRASIASKPESAERFLREARTQGRLEHPAVVPVYDLGQDANGPWFTMQEVRGETLDAVISGLAKGEADIEVRFPRRRLLTAFVQLCRAIDYAHSREVLHGDPKPGNIMLGQFGDVRVLDWGLAVSLGEKANGAGTAGYMSHEQIVGRPLDQRSDVYALGAILFELLAYRPMLEGSAEEPRALAVGEPRDRPPSAVAPDPVPLELDAIVVAATKKDPAQRIQSARELANLVEHYLDGDRDREIQRARAARHLSSAAPLVEAARDRVHGRSREGAAPGEQRAGARPRQRARAGADAEDPHPRAGDHAPRGRGRRTRSPSRVQRPSSSAMNPFVTVPPGDGKVGL